MKKSFLFLAISTLTSLSLYAADKRLNINPDYNVGRGFLGVEVGFGGIGTVSAGVMGGYQYYFKEEWQFAGFRHGIRGFGAVNWATQNYFNGFFAQVGADWTLEFTPKSRFVWGIFLGPSFGYTSILSTIWTASGFVVSGNIGASLTIEKRHRIDLAFGSGFSIVALRYLFHF